MKTGPKEDNTVRNEYERIESRKEGEAGRGKGGGEEVCCLEGWRMGDVIDDGLTPSLSLTSSLWREARAPASLGDLLIFHLLLLLSPTAIDLQFDLLTRTAIQIRSGFYRLSLKSLCLFSPCWVGFEFPVTGTILHHDITALELYKRGQNAIWITHKPSLNALKTNTH